MYTPSIQDQILIGLIFYSPAIIAFLFGSIIGSLSNVIIHRLPYYRSIWSPPSHCTSCGIEIPWYLNIPILSYLLLRGRCRKCGARFSSRYMWVELTSGLLYVLVVLWLYTLPPPQGFGLTMAEILTMNIAGGTPPLGFPSDPLTMLLMLKGFIFVSLLLILTMIDLEHMLLPDRLTIPGTIFGLLLSIAAPLNRPEIANLGTSGAWDAILQSVFGLLIGGAVLIIIAIAAKLLAPVPMGIGDIKLVVMIGAYVGIFGIGPSLFLGFVIGGLLSILLLSLRFAGMKSLIPFGPFLALGGLLGFLWGHQIWFWYMDYMKGGPSGMGFLQWLGIT